MSEIQKAKFRAFMLGMGSVIDLSGRLWSVQPEGSECDALAGDFRRVGEDIATAAEEVASPAKKRDAQQLALPLNA